jgi:hypothetical protein
VAIALATGLPSTKPATSEVPVTETMPGAGDGGPAAVTAGAVPPPPPATRRAAAGTDPGETAATAAQVLPWVWPWAGPAGTGPGHGRPGGPPPRRPAPWEQ